MKIAGKVDLIMLNIFAIKSVILSLMVFKINHEMYLNFKNLTKKGNNSKTSNWIISKIAGKEVLIMLNIFAIKTVILSVTVFEIYDEIYVNF